MSSSRCFFCGARLITAANRASRLSLIRATPASIQQASSSVPCRWNGNWTGSQFDKLLHKFHKPGQNHLSEGYIVTPKTLELLSKHLKETGGKVITRFPPEPNGVLHIGHATAINFNFGYARAHDGICYLRYDDTNPEKEEERFVREIQEMVEWLGHKPYKITHASDYFPQLYEYAVELITRGHAFVCLQPPIKVKGRDAPFSPWRERPVKESLELFEDMRRGKFKEGEATLRMEVTLGDGKQDPVAYRIKYTPHPRTGDSWCIYPTYDYAHCLCDSIENITHSFCSKEFQAKRPSYYWLCNALDVYCPVQWEFSRLNIFYTVVSKRKIQSLINAGVVSDWDDPRLYTLSGLRRRGFPIEAINDFCQWYGVLQSDGAIYPDLLESFIRKTLNASATRTMAVLNPLKVVVNNFPYPEGRVLTVPNVPKDPSRGEHTIPFTKVVYIERADFREDMDKSFWRLTPQQPVGLKYTNCTISVEDIIKDNEGNIAELHASCNSYSEQIPKKDKPKSYIHWVSDPVPCTVRIFNKLFTCESPDEAEDGIISVVNPDSLKVYEGALIDKSVLEAPPLTRFQFERIGYFCVDPLSSPDNVLFNQTVTLKEDRGNPVPIRNF